MLLSFFRRDFRLAQSEQDWYWVQFWVLRKKSKSFCGGECLTKLAALMTVTGFRMRVTAKGHSDYTTINDLEKAIIQSFCQHLIRNYRSPTDWLTTYADITIMCELIKSSRRRLWPAEKQPAFSSTCLSGASGHRGARVMLEHTIPFDIVWAGISLCGVRWFQRIQNWAMEIITLSLKSAGGLISHVLSTQIFPTIHLDFSNM